MANTADAWHRAVKTAASTRDVRAMRRSIRDRDSDTDILLNEINVYYASGKMCNDVFV